LLNKKISISSKDLEKNDIVFNGRGRKRKIRNVSESSSDNNKQLRGSKNNCIDNNVSDSSSRSVTPEILKGKTSTQTITPETITRKSNLRSNDKDQKNKTPIEKVCIKYGFNINLILLEIKMSNFSNLIRMKNNLHI